jgi:hypothetical protein
LDRRSRNSVFLHANVVSSISFSSRRLRSSSC